MADSIPRSSVAAAWFVRASSLIVLILWGQGIASRGWSNNFSSFRGVTGLIGAAMLFLLSFILVTTGRTKNMLAMGTIVLAVAVMALSVAGLVFPRP